MKPGRAKLRPGRASSRAWRAKIRPGRAHEGAWMANRGGGTYGWTDGRKDGRKDGRLEIHPCVLQDIGPLGPLPKKSDGRTDGQTNGLTNRKRKKIFDFILLVVPKLPEV